MADLIQIALRTIIDPTSESTFLANIEALRTKINGKPIHIKVETDNSALNSLIANAESAGSKVNKALKINVDSSGIDKVGKQFKVFADGAGGEVESISRKTTTLTNNLGQGVKEVERFKVSINDAGTLTSTLANKTREYTDNTKQARIENEKLANTIGAMNEKSQKRVKDDSAKLEAQQQEAITRNLRAQQEIENALLATERNRRIEQEKMAQAQSKAINSTQTQQHAQNLRAEQEMEKALLQTQARRNAERLASDNAQRVAINRALEDNYAQSQRNDRARIASQQQASDTARRMMVEEENQRVNTTTNAQRRIQQAITGSNETINQQQARMNANQANGYRYEQMFLQASREREALDRRNLELGRQEALNSVRNLEAERLQTAELQRRIRLYQEQNALQLRNIQSQYGSLARTPAIQSQISGVQGVVGGLTSSVLDANGFRAQSAQINTSINGIRASLNEARLASNSFGNDLVHNGIKMLEWTVVGGLIFGTLTKIKEGFTFINTLDKSMTNISMIMGNTRGEIVEMTKAYADLASQLHTTTGEAMKSAEEFLRAGHNQESTLKLIQSATVMGAIAGQDSKSSADQLIAITNGFKMNAEETMDVVDKLTTVDNMSATSTRELGTALQRTSVSAQMAGTSFSELVSYIATVSSVSRKSASSIGESFKTIFSRFQDVRGGKNFDAENQDISNVERDFKKYADISIRETSGEFKDFTVVINDLSSKWNTLSEVEQSATAKALAGTRQRENFLILMNNMSTALELQASQLDSSGSAMTRYGEYAKSTEAKLNDLTNATQKIWLNLLSSDFINSAIGGLTTFVTAIGDVTSTFSGLATAVYIAISALVILKSQAIAGLVASISQWVVAFGLAETATLGFSMGIRALSTAMLGLIANPIFLAVAAVGALTYAFVSYAGSQAKIKKQLEETNKAQTDFNSSIKQFQDTLDSKKIEEVASSLEKLKEATKYDENIKAIEELKKSISSFELSPVGTEDADMSGFVEEQKQQLADLEDKVKLVTNAQEKYDEQKKIAIALDYESVQTGNKKIALKIRENESNRQLIDSYQKVHDKMAQGNKLSSEEENLNQRMIDKYPEYVKVLNDKTSAVGLDIVALKANQTAEEALAIVSFNAMKTKAESSAIATKQIIADTEARIHAIQAEIEALQGKNEAMGSANANIQYQKLLDQGSAKTFMEFKNDTILNDTITPKLKIDLSGAYKQLQTAKQTLGAWNTLSNMSLDDLKKSVASGSSFDPPKGDKDKKANKEKELSIESLTEALLAQINAEHLLTKEKSDSISKEINRAKSAKKYQEELELTNSLISNQVKELSELSVAKDKINFLKDSVLSSGASQFGDTNRWFTGQDNKESVAYVNEHNEASEENRKIMEEQFSSLQKLRNAWVDNSKLITENKDETIALSQSLQDINYSIVKKDIEPYTKEITFLTEQISLLKTEQEQYDKQSSQYSDSQKQQIELLKQKSELIQEEIDQLQILISTTKLSAEAQEELQSTISSLYSSLASNKNETLSIYNSIADSIISTMKKAYEKQKDIALASIEEEITAEDKRHDKKLVNLDKEMKKYQDAYDAKLKLIDDEANNEDYATNLSKAQKEKQDIQNKVNILSLDTSIEGRFKREQLETELAEKITAIQEMQKDRERDLRKDALSDQLDDYKEDIDSKIDSENAKNKSIKASLDQQKKDTEYMYNELINDERNYAKIRLQIINGNVDGVKTKLNSFLEDFDDMNKSTSESIGESWQDLLNLIDEVKSASESVKDVKSSKDSSSKSESGSSSGTVTKPTVYGVKTDIDLAKTVSNASSFNFKTVNDGDASESKKGDIILGGSAVIKDYGLGSAVYGLTAEDTFERFKLKASKYALGGETSTTGIHWLDGKIGKPERVLSPEQTASFNKLVDFLPKLNVMDNIMKNFKLPDFSNIKFPSMNTTPMTVENTIHFNIDGSNGLSKSDLNKAADYVFSKIGNGMKMGFGVK